MSTSRFPFSPYPRGWYQVANSPDIKPGGLKTVKFFNKELIVARGQSGKARVMDAHCPHLGAHIGKGGKVVGDDIQCPFHGWQFGEDGNCTKIPYCDHIPKKAKLGGYVTQEVGDVIFIYFGNEGTAIEPEFTLPACEEFHDDKWSKPLHLGYNLQSHVQEMAENTVDTGHFPLIHDYFKVPKITELIEDKTTFTVVLDGERKVLGIKTYIHAELESRGLGAVFAKTETNFLSIRALHCATPIDDNEIQVNVTFVFKKTRIPGLDSILKRVLPKEVFQFTSGDHLVLNHKAYRDKPILCRADGPIIQFRHWAKQFYEPLHTQSKLHSSPAMFDLGQAKTVAFPNGSLSQKSVREVPAQLQARPVHY